MKDATMKEKTTFIRRRTTLLHRIDRLRTCRDKFIPGLTHYLNSICVPDVPRSTPELIPLYPPSAIPTEDRRSVCAANIDQIEERLRFAQASEALTQLRLQLAKRTCASRYKFRGDVSQQYFTRFRELLEQTEIKIKAARVHYNTARKALMSLCGPGDWEETYQVLKASDVVGLGERVLVAEEKAINERMEKLAGLDGKQLTWDAADAYHELEPQPLTAFVPQLARGEGTRTLSWIWYSAGDQELKNQTTEACTYYYNSLFYSL